MSSYSNAGAGSAQASVQYDIDNLSADIRTQGNQAWRHNNVALMPFNFAAKAHNAIGMAYGVAIFNDKSDSEDAFIEQCQHLKYQDKTLGDMLNIFIPDYVVEPPEWDAEKEQPILPWLEQQSGLDMNAVLTDYDAFLEIVKSHIGWQTGTTTTLTKDTAAKAPHTHVVSGNNVLINGKTAVHKDSGGSVQTVDVCLTTIGNSVVPIAYGNSASSSDAASTASSVLINGNPACHLGSNFSKSSGDSGGDKKGVASGVVEGKAEFLMGSNNVLIEGNLAVRQGDLMVSNNKNTPPAPLSQPSGPMPQGLSVETPDDLAAQETGRATAVIVKGATPEDLSLGHVMSQTGAFVQKNSVGSKNTNTGDSEKTTFVAGA